MLPAYHTKKETDYEFEVQLFGPAVHIAVIEKIHNFSATFCDDSYKNICRKVFQKDWVICVSRKYFEQQGHDDPAWVLNIPQEEQYIAISAEYFEAYQNGESYGFRGRKSHFRPLREVLQDRIFHLVVCETPYGLCDLDGKLIPFKNQFNYIDLDLTDNQYDIDSLAEHLTKSDKVVDLQIVDIPDYNSEMGERGIELTYQLSSEEIRLGKRDIIAKFLKDMEYHRFVIEL